MSVITAHPAEPVKPLKTRNKLRRSTRGFTTDPSGPNVRPALVAIGDIFRRVCSNGELRFKVELCKRDTR